MFPRFRRAYYAFLKKHFSGTSISYQEVFQLLLPIGVDQAFVVGLALINTAMISSSGVAAISAVNMVESLNIFLLNIFIAVATGGTVAVAQYYGSRNEKMVSRSAAGTISAVLCMSLGIAIILIIFHNQVLTLLFGGAEKAVMANARIYLIGCLLSYPAIGIVEAACGALRGVGETKSTLFLSLVMNLTYVLLNFVFIQGFHFGVLGMVISLNIARYFAAICSLWYLVKQNFSLHFRLKSLYSFDFFMIKKISLVGIPFAAEQMFFNGGKILTQIFIVSLGTYALTTNAIANSLTALLEILPSAMSIALVTIVGQCVGRKNIADARKFVRSLLWLASASTVIVAAILIPAYPFIIQVFNTPATIVPDIFKLLVYVSVARILFWPASFMVPSALRAAGDAKFTSITSMISMWLLRVLLGYLLGIVFHMGVVGVWLAMMFEWGVRGLVFRLRFKGEKWHQKTLIDD